ncbi:MAG TPA: hypothetical protein VGN07_22715 [Steroidobacteraceae bacterium]
MRAQVLSVCVILLAAVAAQARGPEAVLSDIQRSHIEGNVPVSKDFDSFLHRDVAAYFRSAIKIENPTIEIELLRNGPTQSGVAYPKYYAWVVVKAENREVAEGALRVAAIDEARFEVTDFLSKSSIRSSPASVSAAFPASLVGSVIERASK